MRTTFGQSIKVITATGLLISSIFFSSLSEASSVRVDRQGGHERGYAGLPDRATRIFVGGVPYYYHEGTYYSGLHNRYIVVAAPVGAVIARLPHRARKFWHEGRPYYRHGSVCYARVRGGWQVVPLTTRWR